MSLKALLEEVVEPHRGFDLAFDVLVKTPPGQPAPRVRRLPEVIHGLSTLVENAADFAAATVRVQAVVDAYLQQSLGIRYMRAADLIDRMEREGIVGAAVRGNRPILGMPARTRIV